MNWWQRFLTVFTLGAKRSSHWSTVRRHHLEQYPLCAACGGEEDLQVHHVVPFHDDATKELDPGNLITLCEHPSKNCHFVFGHAGHWKGWNPHVRQDAAIHLDRVQMSVKLSKGE